jgi:pilus assembly protein Flp/PilA
MFKSIRNKKSKGQGMVEYALILVLVAVVVIAALTVMGPQVRIVYIKISAAMVSTQTACDQLNAQTAPINDIAWVGGKCQYTPPATP